MSTRLVSLGGIVLLAVLFLGLNIWLGSATRSVRLDLTQQHLYTLSKGSRNIAGSFKEPVHLTLYYSSKLAQGKPQIQAYGVRVRELLEEYANISGGKIVLRVVDPQPFTEDEDAAVQGGLSGIPVGPGETLYFGLVGTNEVDTHEVIPIFDPAAERFLEYDVSRLLYSLANPKKKTVGLLTSLSMEGFRMTPTGQPQQIPPWAIMRELRGVFNVKTLTAQNLEITPDIDVLLLIHPKNLPPSAVYAIDQYVLKGGKLLAIVDPLCEADQSGADPRNPMAAMMADRSSDKVLQKLFDAWGVRVEPGKIAGDFEYAPKVMANDPSSRQEPVSYLAWLDLPSKAFDRQDATTGLLSRVIMASAGIISPGSAEAAKPPENKPDEAKADDQKAGDEKKDAPADAKGEQVKPEASKAEPVKPAEPARVVIKPLITTTDKAMRMDQSSVAFMPDPKALLANYVPGGQALVLAARLELAPGAKLVSAFPDGKPSDPPAPNNPAPPPPSDAKVGFVGESTGPLNAAIIADADFLNDRFWVQEERFGQLSLGARKIADNGDFVVNLLDNLCGSSDLIAVRARGEFARPFTKVQEIQREAEQKYRAEEQGLQDELKAAQTKIDELQRAAPGKENSLIISDEQRKEIDEFRKKVVTTRTKLRSVQANLRRDIDALDNRLTFINIGLVPILVTLAAVGLGMYRVSRRRAGAGVEPVSAPKGAAA